MWRLLFNWMGTNTSWETSASFCSVRRDVGDIRLVHYMQQPLWSALHQQIFITAFLRNSFGNFLSLYRWMLQLAVNSATWCQCICLSAGTSVLQIYVTFWLQYRGSMLHRSADMFVLWPNIPCQACLESYTEIYLKDSRIKHVCRRWSEW